MDHTFVPYPFTATQYAATLPPLTAGTDAKRHAVVVVGGGPVGLCTALGLATQGVPVVLLEADDSVCAGSRAICISRRSLQIVERLGAGAGFMQIGLPWTGGRSFYHDQEVLQFTMPQDENQKLPPMVNLAQYHIEQILLERARQLPELIDIRWQSKLTAIKTGAAGARLDVTTPLGDYSLDADWVVAADGGRSFIRESLGLALQGTSYEGRYVIVDILLDTQRHTERLAYFDPPCNPGSTVLVHKQPDNVWRIDYQLRDGEDPVEAVKPENVMPRIESLLEMMGEKGAWSPIWITIYKANALTLDRYRHGRVLFAGDAAHLLPIFGVRGANSGIDDADNLAWKLALVAKGRASDSLLDSYSHERLAAAHENLSHGSKSTEFMAPPSFAFDLMRRAVLGLAVDHPRLQSLINPRQTSAITYDTSPLNAAAEASAAFTAGPVPGAVFLECPVTLASEGVPQLGFISDLAGADFTALLFSDDPAGAVQLQTLANSNMGNGGQLSLRIIARQSPTTPGSPAGLDAWDHTGRLYDLYDATAGCVYLLRPDGHVLARWRQPAARDIEQAIAHVLQNQASTPNEALQ